MLFRSYMVSSLVLAGLFFISLLGGCCNLCPVAKETNSPVSKCDVADLIVKTDDDKKADNCLFLYCGAAIRKPMAEINKNFEAETGIRIEPTFTGSGCLLAQIELAEKGDLYMPGEDWFMQQAVERDKIINWKRVAYFVPVIMVQRGNPYKISSISDLMQPGIRVGIGETKSCAIGHFTVRLLEETGIPLEKFMKYVVAQFATAPELGNSIKIKSIDACIQWDSLAALYTDDTEVVAFPVTEKTSSAVTLGILKTTKKPELAAEYLKYVAGPKGQDIFKKYHFTLDLNKPTFPPKTQEK